MKKRQIGLIAVLVCVFLTGCKSIVRTDFDFDTGNLSKAQKIVIADASGNEKAVLTEEADIDAFVEAINAEHWKLAELPENAAKAGTFTLYQTETITALMGEKEAEMVSLCAFELYEDGRYLVIDTFAMGITIPFQLSERTAAYLMDLLV